MMIFASGMNHERINDLEDIKPLFKPGIKILILCHWNPDGDAIGSVLGLQGILKNIGFNAEVMVPNDYPDFLQWLPGNEHIHIYIADKEKGKKLLNEADVIFCLDFNSLTRIGEMSKTVFQMKCPKVVIDHHLQPSGFANYHFIDTQASSTAEMVYRFTDQLGWLNMIDEAIAYNLYTGILTDTGSFQFSSTSSAVHKIVAELIEHGVKPDFVFDRVFNRGSERRLRFRSMCIKDRMELFPEYHCGLIAINYKDVQDYSVDKSDTEGLVNVPLQIDGIHFSALIIDRGDAVKTSFRSFGSFDVNQYSRENFSGGGHLNAAGGIFKGSFDEAVTHFKNLLPKYKIQLNETAS